MSEPAQIIPKSAIFYLVNDNPTHLGRLLDSLDLLQQNFLSQYPYPVVIGHEGLSFDTIEEITSHLPNNHFFHKVNFKLPEYPENILSQIPEKFKGHWDEGAYFSMGYRHMCRYFAGGIYKDPTFEKTKYLLRLDCDSYITDKMLFDPFRYMANKGIKYATVAENNNEMEYVTLGLSNFLRGYFGKDRSMPAISGMFETNFELVDFQWFRGNPYMEYFDAIDKSGGIYIHRWGDAPLKYQGVKALLTAAECAIFGNIPYKHGGNYK